MIWSIFALAAVIGAAGMPLLHQHFRPETLPMLFWLRVFSFLCMTPVVLYLGVPGNMWFYVGTAVIALWMAITDMMYFNGVKNHGAGVVSRILPIAAIPTFFLWFAVKPELIETYINDPYRSVAILACLMMGVYFATRMRHDPVSLAAVRDIWFVILGASLGPIAAKIVLGFAPMGVSGLAFIWVQAAILAPVYAVYAHTHRPLPLRIFWGRHALAVGAVIAVASMLSIGAKSYAFLMAENPAYVSVVLFTAPFLISLYERMIGHKDESDRRAGFGLVLAAAALVLLQIK